MQRKNRWILIGLIAVAAMVFGLPAYAQHEGHGGHELAAAQMAETPTTETATGVATSTEAAAGSDETAAQLKPQETCPIMGGTIDKKQFVDADGHRIYVCCPACIGQVKANPKKALDVLKARGEKAELLPSEDAKDGDAVGKQPTPSSGAIPSDSAPSEPAAEKKS